MDVENLYLIYNYQVVINMIKLSIFSLIRLNNQEANNELIQRYDTYKNQTPLVGTKTKLKNIFKNIINYLDENKNIQIDEWEEYAKYFDLNNMSEFSNEITLIASKNFFQSFICYTIKESYSFNGLYLAIFLANFVKYNNNDLDFIETMKVLTTNIFCAFQSLYVLKDTNEYSYLHHNVYYNFVPQQNTTLVDFFIDYPDENDQSLFYIFKQKENYSFPRKSYKSSITNNDKKIFEQLIDKHNNILESYKQVTECLTDFESFFSRHNNILDLVEIYRKKIIANFDNYPYITNFVLTLLTQTKEINCFCFALTCLDFFDYEKDFVRLYKIVESFLIYPYLTPFCLIALRNLNNYQQIIRKSFNNSSQETEFILLSHLDFTNEENFKFLIKNINHPLIKNMFLESIYQFNIKDKINDLSLNEELINDISTLLIKTSLLNPLIFNQIQDYDKLIIKFYNNFYEKIKDKHYLNNVLYYTFERRSTPKDKKIFNYISKKIIYEDELTYIDEQLFNPNMNVEEIAFLINYYDYVNIEQAIKMIKSNPKKYLKLMYAFKNDVATLEELLDYLDNSYKINNNHLDTFNYQEKLSIKEIDELIDIISLLTLTPYIYLSLYKIGLKYYFSSIRALFYTNICNLVEQNYYIDDELIEIIRINQQYEKDENILKVIQIILSKYTITIS